MSLKFASSVSTAKKKFLTGLDKKYAEHLHQVIDEIFEVAAERWSWMELAEEAGVAYTTVLKLGNRLTHYPRHMTVWKLAKAVGLQAEFIQVMRRKAG